ncbi:MAG: addiction module protein [Pseudomonadota bacterium]|nr:addiction module protein [Pseudomonadota bacterium]
MTMITVEQLKHLSFAEKLQLVEDLWDDIAQEAAARPPTEAQRRVLDERLAAHQREPGRGRTWDEIKAEIEQTHASTV